MTIGSTDPTAVIRELNAQGKDAREIAIELVNRGIHLKAGRAWSADMVASILRIMGEKLVRPMAVVAHAGKSARSIEPSNRQTTLAAGEIFYDGVVCRKCGTTRKYTSISACVQCNRDRAVTNNKRRSGATKRNKWNPHSHFSDAQKTEIMRLFQHEGMKSGDIAKRLGLPVTRVNPFCASLSGFSVPPGEIIEVIDDQGRKVMKCPPGWARGAYPQRNVGCKGGA